jgi:hypothetical protein
MLNTQLYWFVWCHKCWTRSLDIFVSSHESHYSNITSHPILNMNDLIFCSCLSEGSELIFKLLCRNANHNTTRSTYLNCSVVVTRFVVLWSIKRQRTSLSEALSCQRRTDVARCQKHCLVNGAQTSLACLADNSCTAMEASVALWCKNTDRGERKNADLTRTRAPVMRGRRLTAWGMALEVHVKNIEMCSLYHKENTLRVYYLGSRLVNGA